MNFYEEMKEYISKLETKLAEVEENDMSEFYKNECQELEKEVDELNDLFEIACIKLADLLELSVIEVREAIIDGYEWRREHESKS